MASTSPRQYVNIEQKYLLYIIFGDEIYSLVDLYDIRNNKERKILDITKKIMSLPNMENKLDHYYIWLRESIKINSLFTV